MSEQNRTTATHRRPDGPSGGHRPGPRGHMSMMKGEKARDFKGTMGKLLEYLGSYKTGILIVMIFAIIGTDMGDSLLACDWQDYKPGRCAMSKKTTTARESSRRESGTNRLC